MTTIERPVMTPLERVATALSCREPDRVPMALAVGLHAGKQLGIPLPEVYTDPRNVVEGMLRLTARYGSDVVQGTWYAPLEHEAWGGETIFFEDGPPNAGAPVIRSVDAIPSLEPPRPADHRRATWMLASIAELRRRLGPDVPILGGVVSPNSLPIMLMGFNAYLDLLLERRDRWWQLVDRVAEWTVAWGNAQLAAGATALAYFDPVASSTIVPPALYAETGAVVAKRVLPRLGGPTATLLASGRALPVIPALLGTGTQAIGPSSQEDLAEVVAAVGGRAAVVGTLNGLAMRHWTEAEAEAEVRRVIDIAGPGGGFLLCDNHGEIPFQVPDATLAAIAEAVRRWGRYPLPGPVA